MKRLTRFTLFLAAFAGINGEANAQTDEFAFVAADAGDVAIMGRVAMIDGSARMGFPGVSLRFNYVGPSPTLRMTGESENCYFNVSLNGADPVVMRLEQGENEVELPYGVAPASGWVVDIVRRTESWMGEAVFHGLSLPEGCELLAPPSYPRRRLMFIGDSTTCGEYNERFPPIEEISPATTNAARSFAMIIAKELNAQAHLIAYGGQGIVRDWSGETEGEKVVLAPQYFERSAPSREEAFWNHRNYTPEVIVISLGTDFDAGLIEQETYNEIYLGFVMQVRTSHPLSHIIMTDSAFLSDEPGSQSFEAREVLRMTLETVLAQSREAGDERIHYVRSGYYPGTKKDTHLIVQQHRALAKELLGPIRQITGWQ